LFSKEKSIVSCAVIIEVIGKTAKWQQQQQQQQQQKNRKGKQDYKMAPQHSA
jgi:hypothetical protein